MENKVSLNKKRTKYCGEFNNSDLKKTVTVMGWVQKQRNLGNLIFIDLRDRTGIVQLAVTKTNSASDAFSTASLCKTEYVIMATGVVSPRKDKNSNMKTGDIEIQINYLKIISKSQTPPFEILKSSETSLELRLKYRYLDLRHPDLQKTFLMRHKITKHTRDFFSDNNFLEIETPMLVKSTPEGARDYLVPSRVNKNKFYALPQSPQLYKQILMISGFDRYFQIARCFRDEDLRADRQPEFSQIDLEMSFVDEEDIMEINEKYVKSLFLEILNIKIETPFKRLSYKEAMEKFGSDKPDLRFNLQLICLNDVVSNSSLNVFKEALKESGAVYAINLKDHADKISRKEIDKLTDLVKTYKAKGLFFSKILKDSPSSNFEKFLTKNEIELIYEKTKAKENDIIFIVADKDTKTSLLSLGALRTHLGAKFNLYDPEEFSFLWVINFPLFEYSEEEKRYVSKHHPFTAIVDEDLHLLQKNPEECRAKAYDLILNGCEVGGGSIRIHDENIQNEIFKTLKMEQEEIEEKFGFLLEALKYGTPIHGGMAYGLDRLVMLMLKKSSIRDVIAFPKLQNASEIMSNAPNSVSKKQLEELNIKLK